MKKNRFLVLFIFSIFGFTLPSLAQSSSNDWINYNQSYYKFKIVEDGVYRISYSDMQNVGIPVSSINPANFQIFGRGEEIYLHLQNQISGIMSPGDYIEFYAQKNDGWYDSVLYRKQVHQPNMGYSLFNDTATYYLTWNSSFTNNRYSLSTDVNFSAYQINDYVHKVVLESYSNNYLEGIPIYESNSETTWNPEYANGEGFYGSAFYLGGTRTYNLPTKNAYNQGNAQVKFLLHGASNYRNLIYDHHVRIEFGNVVIDTIFEGYQVLIFNEYVANNQLGSNNTTFTFSSINDLGSGADRNAVAYIQVQYYHTLDFEGTSFFDFEVDDLGQGKSYLNVSNFSGGTNPILYDLDNHRRINVVQNGSNYQMLIPNGNGRKKCILLNSNQVNTGLTLKPVGANAKFKNYFALNPGADYLLISHSALMGNGGAYLTADDYANYRNSTGYNVMLADIDDLYDQYAYGIAKNPMAIRNFVKEAYDKLNAPPKHLFLIGKAYYPQVYRKNTTYYNETFVPSFGSPPSDVLLTAYVADTTYAPSVSTGRLAAKNLDHTDLYLKKVMLYEDEVNNPPDLWKKKALFFSGGSESNEQSTIRGYMNGYEKIYKDTLFGGNVKTFYKTTTDPIQINLSEAIKKEINGGVNMLNFFGHAAGVGFDISIDNPAEYNNYGKYPFLIANSCFAGDIFQPNVGVANSSEAFILIRDKGAIAYLGSVTPGLKPYLNLYTKSFFKHYSYLNYNEPLGMIIYNSISSIYSNFVLTKEIIMEMVLHGDPALVLNSSELPDYQINETSFYTDPGILTTEYDSFAVNIIVSNPGKAVPDTMVIEFERTLPDLQTKQLRKYRRKATFFQDTIVVWFPINKLDDLGKNTLLVRVDAYSDIIESKENNNTYTYTFDIKAADLKPVYPPEFAIVASQNPTLRASTFYPLSDKRDYVFELDTTIYFNSPLLETAKVSSAGGVVEYTVNQQLMDSVVYYWRASLDSTSKNGYNWRNSSFHYIPGLHGWSQSHFFQFKNNNYQLTVFNEAGRTFDYVNDVKVIKCVNGIVPYIAWTEPQYLINNVQQSYADCVDDGVKIAVINPISGKPWVNIYPGNPWADYGSYTCRPYNHPMYEFSTITFPSTAPVSDTAWYQRISDFISIIPDGYHVLFRTVQNSHITSWPEHLYKSMDSIGANFHRAIPDNRPYIVWGTKGDLGNGLEVIGDSIQATISLTDSFTTNWKEGLMSTPLIGPTQKWSTLSWKISSQESINTDEVSLIVLGVRANGVEDTISILSPDSALIQQLNNRMPANDYPYCRLVMSMKDDSLYTPPLIESLKLYYSEVPELAVAPKTKYVFHSDTIQRGDTMRIQMAYRNISDQDLMDSLLVNYWLVDNQNVRHDLGTRRLSPMQAHSSLVDSFRMGTTQLSGSCSFFIEINPINSSTGVYDQLEQTHINNTLEVPFLVVEDQSNPLLDITFDGIHILDGDLVSSRPEIVMMLKDDNPYIALDDTTLFTVYLTSPDNLARKRVYFMKNGQEQMSFTPAELPDNKARIIYAPEFIQDGEYTLYVQAVDKSTNLSGLQDYEISFNVVNKSTITHLMNWPNPFTTKTHFVFTLTGSQVPDYMLIQIMTISGKVVREIDMSELGPLHIGRNITEFAWDGTDSFGDRLANGVYLYRVISKLNGEQIEHRASGADTYFTKDFGKMYLML